MAVEQATPGPVDETWLLRISETTVDNKKGVTTGDCAMVLTDGRFRIERRTQKLPSASAAVKVYESSLDSSQFENLSRVLEREALRGAQRYSEPTFSLDLPWFSNLDAKIRIEGKVRRLGYWELPSGGPAPSGLSDQLRGEWQDTKKALQPLVEWFHGIETLKLPVSDAEPTHCAVE